MAENPGNVGKTLNLFVDKTLFLEQDLLKTKGVFERVESKSGNGLPQEDFEARFLLPEK